MEFLPYLQVLWRRKWVVVLTCALTVGVALAVTALMPPAYRVIATLRVITPNEGGWSNTPYADRLNNTYIRIVNSEAILRELRETLQIEEVPEVTVSAVPNTELLELIMDTADPVIVNTLADILVSRNRELYFGDRTTGSEMLLTAMADIEHQLDAIFEEYGTLDPQIMLANDVPVGVRRTVDTLQQRYSSFQFQYQQALVREAAQANALFVVEPAEVPERPYRPVPLLNILIGAFVGLLGGVGLALLFENLDSLLYTSKQIEALTGMPLLGKIPPTRRAQQIATLNENFAHAEAFRRLRVNIAAATTDQALGKLLVTSAEPREGKTTVIANLAAVIAQSEQQVVLVEGNLRRPGLHEFFGLPNKVGLTSVIYEKASLEDALRPTKVPGVFLLPSGPLPANPAEVLASPRLFELINHLGEQFDYVLIDTPALQAVADASFLMPSADGVLLVLGRKQVKREAVTFAMEQLRLLKTRVLGVIVNRAETFGTRARFYEQLYRPARRAAQRAAAGYQGSPVTKDA